MYHFVFRRFTGVLAKTASHVTAVDFMEQFINKNKELHGHLDNVDFLQADVTKLELPKNRLVIQITMNHNIQNSLLTL